MPNYTKQGKILIPLTEKQFQEGMRSGHFCQAKHRGFAALLYYTGVRVSEALRAKREQFTESENILYFSVGVRLKKQRAKTLKETGPLPIHLDRPFAYTIFNAVEETKRKKRVWPYSRMTGYNIIARVWRYPHHLRLTRITNFAAQGYRYTKLRSWTALSLSALEFYIGLVDIKEMGEA